MGDLIPLESDLNGRILIGNGVFALESPVLRFQRFSAFQEIQREGSTFGLRDIGAGEREKQGQDHDGSENPSNEIAVHDSGFLSYTNSCAANIRNIPHFGMFVQNGRGGNEE